MRAIKKLTKIVKSDGFKVFGGYGLIFVLMFGYSLITASKLFLDSSDSNLEGYIKTYEIEYVEPGRGRSYTTYTPVVEVIENGVARDILISSAESKIIPNRIGDKVNIRMFNNDFFIDTLFYKLVELFKSLGTIALFSFIGVILVIISNKDNLKGMSLGSKSIISSGLFFMTLAAGVAIGILSNLKMNQIAIVHSEVKFTACIIVITLFICSLIAVIVDSMKFIKSFLGRKNNKTRKICF